MAMFDKTFPTLDCAACILTPKMSALGKDPNITLHGLLRGRAGRRLRRQLHGQGPQEGALRQHRHLHRLRRLPGGLRRAQGARASSTRGSATAAPSTFRSRRRCRCAPRSTPPSASRSPRASASSSPACRPAAPGAIDFEQKDEVVELDVGAIIMATGFELWDPAQESRYGYGRLDNVITSLEFERISNASGPTGGHIVCKNGEAPKSVAILHCVGSRDENYQEFCSRVCCMYSLKFSHLIKEHLPETEVYELYIDMRCYGKGYEEFYKRLMDEGVQLRPRPRRRGHRRRPLARRRGAPRRQDRRHAARHRAAHPGRHGDPVERPLAGVTTPRRSPRSSASAAAPTASTSSAIPSSSRSAPSPTASSSPAAASTPRTSPTRSPRRAPRRPAPWPWSTTRRSRSSRRSPTSIPRSARAATSAWACARTTRSSTTKRRTRRGDRGGLQGLWRVRRRLRLQRAAAARLPRRRRSSPRSKGRWPSRPARP